MLNSWSCLFLFDAIITVGSSLDPDLHHFDLDIQGRSGCEQSQLLTPHLKCQYTIENLLRSLLGSKILKRFWTFQNPSYFRTTFGFSTATNILKCKVTFQNQCQALRTFVIGLEKIILSKGNCQLKNTLRIFLMQNLFRL